MKNDEFFRSVLEEVEYELELEELELIVRHLWVLQYFLPVFFPKQSFPVYTNFVRR